MVGYPTDYRGGPDGLRRGRADQRLHDGPGRPGAQAGGARGAGRDEGHQIGWWGTQPTTEEGPMAFDVDELISGCTTALADPEPRRAVREVLAETKAIRSDGGVPNRLPRRVRWPSTWTS